MYTKMRATLLASWSIAVFATAITVNPTHMLADQAASTAFAAGSVAQKGTIAPVRKLTGLDGKTYTIGRGNGKIQLLSFWASWCDPCRIEAPLLNELAVRYRKELDIYGINVTKYDRQEDVQKFVTSLKLSYPILLDKSGEIFDIYRGVAFPTSVLIDGKGTVHDILLGVYSKKELEHKIRKLIGELGTKS